MKNPETKEEFVKYLRSRKITFDEFYDVILKSYFDLTTDERASLIQKTHSYKDLKGGNNNGK